jgi:translocation and assembly module TamA
LESIDPGDLRYGAGPGLRIATPVGLIRFDLGVKLDRERSESRVEFYLDVGQAF